MDWFLYDNGVATGGTGGPWPPHINFRTKQGPAVSFPNIRDISFYECSEIIWTKNLTIYIVYVTIFRQFTVAFQFFKLHRGNTSPHFTKGSILNALPSEKGLTLDFVLFLIIIFISFLANSSHFIYPENTRKPLAFWCFQGVLIEKIGQKLVKINPTLRE